ncbi:MAG: YajQ family cyclic di-GMP-binding protein [Myxococcaceae bacterium]
MPSFDVVSKVDLQEVDNAVNNARKELSTRFDFQGTKTEITLGEDNASVLLRSNSEPKLDNAYEVFLNKAVKRGLSAFAIHRNDVEQVGMGMVKQVITIKQGISQENAKDLIRVLKDSKLKVQGSIQADQLRITGKNRDDLQAAIALLRQQQERLTLDLQFTNFRE